MSSANNWDPEMGLTRNVGLSENTTQSAGRGGQRRRLKNPLHEAIKEGDVTEVIKLMKFKDLLQPIPNRRSALHWACNFVDQPTALEMVKAIIDNLYEEDLSYEGFAVRNVIESQDRGGNTCLHIAAKQGHAKVVEDLLDYFPKTSIRNQEGIQAMELIYRYAPAAVCKMLDNAIQREDGNPKEDNLEVCLDFGCIIGTPEITKDTNYEQETNFLLHSLHHSGKNKKDILLHPLVQLFLYLKWKKVRSLIYLSMVYHIVWMSLYTAVIVNLYMVQCPYEINSDEDDSQVQNNVLIRLSTGNTSTEEHRIRTNQKETDGSFTCDSNKHNVSSITAMVVILYVITITIAVKELFEIYANEQLKQYFKQLENIGQWLVMVIVVITTMPIFGSNIHDLVIIQSWQYQMSAVGVILAWSLILSQIGYIPALGVYIEILVKVLGSYCMVMITFLSLLVAFKFSFQILLPENEEFRSFPWGFIKMLDMMIGEVNYSDLFYSEDGEAKIPFPILTKILIVAFVSVVTIVLFNLLIGLTVNDIDDLRGVAEFSSLSKQIININLMEQFYISDTVQGWLKYFNKQNILKTFLVCQQASSSEKMLQYVIPIYQIPVPLQEDIRETVVKNMETPEKDYENDEQSIVDDLSDRESNDGGQTSEQSEDIMERLNMITAELSEIQGKVNEILNKLDN